MTHPCSCKDCPSWHKSLFSELSEVELAEFIENKKPLTLKKNDFAFSQADATTGLYCIGSGGMKITQKINSQDTLIRLAPPGDTVGHRSLFLDKTYKGSAIAVTKSHICFVSTQEVNRLLNTNTSFALKLIKKMAADTNLTEELNISQRQKNVRERFAECLIFLHEHFSITRPDGTSIIELKLSRQEMASLIGTAPDTIIRLFSEFKENGWVGESDKILVILDLKMVRTLAGVSLQNTI